MTRTTISLDNYPAYDEVSQFLQNIMPRLDLCDGIWFDNYDYPADNPSPNSLAEEPTAGGALATFGVYDDDYDLFIFENELFTYSTMADLARVLEMKQVEMQLNALQTRLVAVGWKFKYHAQGAKHSAEGWTLQRNGAEEPFTPNYASLYQLRQELARTEATQWVQSHWLELEAAGCTIQFGPEAIIVRQDADSQSATNHRLYGYTLEEAKDLVRAALGPKPSQE